MPTFRFLHCADIHLDSPLRGLSAYEGAPVEKLRGATRRALENLVQLAIEEPVDFVVIAGDLYDGPWQDYNTGLYFIRQMAVLDRAKIRVFVVRGNHDAESVITDGLVAALPSSVKLFAAAAPETVVLPEQRIAIHGQSFATKNTTTNLVAGYPALVPDCFNLGILHTALTGKEPHERYAPCELGELIQHGYDYWALGHVHAREVVHENPYVVFPGNIQGRHIRETGPKGVTLVTVEGGSVTALEHRPVDVLRWERIVVDVSSCVSRAEVLERTQQRIEDAAEDIGDRALAVRVHLTGQCPCYGEILAGGDELRQEILGKALSNAHGKEIWVEKVETDLSPVLNHQGMPPRDEALAEILGVVETFVEDPAAMEAIMGEMDELLAKIPEELRSSLSPLGDPATFRATLAEVGKTLIAELGGESS